MSAATAVDVNAASSGKTHQDENFPVASALIAPRHRPAILAFYNFVRAADDIADHAELAPEAKLHGLDHLEAALLGQGPDEPVAAGLREALQERALPPTHAQDLLTAFRRDVVQLRYSDFDELIDYCRYSAMPVGRFVLDVHGENPQTTWPANDALCAALQIINHLQDCAKDYLALDRVYLPEDMLKACGARVEMLREPKSPAPLRAAITAVAQRTRDMLESAQPFALRIADTRLAMEVGAIQKIAEYLTQRLLVADPLSEKVHAGKPTFLALAGTGALGALFGRLSRRAGGAA